MKDEKNQVTATTTENEQTVAEETTTEKAETESAFVKTN